MHNPPRILIVDDNETNRDILLTGCHRRQNS
jgi:CheY-like chemotaxis protein